MVIDAREKGNCYLMLMLLKNEKYQVRYRIFFLRITNKLARARFKKKQQQNYLLSLRTCLFFFQVPSDAKHVKIICFEC